MRERGHIIGIVAAYVALFMLLCGHFLPEVLDYVLPSSIGLAVVGVLMPLWYFAGRQK